MSLITFIATLSLYYKIKLFYSINLILMHRIEIKEAYFV